MPYDNFNDSKSAADALRRSRAAARKRKERKKKLMIRRTIIVAVCALIVFTAVFLVVKLVQLIFGGGDNSKAEPKTDTVYEVSPETEAPTEDPRAAGLNDPHTFFEPKIKDDKNVTGHISASNSGVYIYNNMAFELFGGSDSAAEYYAKTISEFKKNASEYTVYNMVVPVHAEYALPRRLIEDGTVPTTIAADVIKKVYESYTEDVKPINCYNHLSEHNNEYIYFNTDHHWSGLGAYYAYKAFCEQTGQEPLDLSTCTEHTIPDFTGTLSDYDETVKNNPDTVHYWTFPYATHARQMPEMGDEMIDTSIYYEDSSGGLAYGVFIYGDSPLFIEYNDDLKNGKKIAVVKESYGNAFVPYLTNNYQEVHVIDPRHWTGNLKSYMQDNDIDEVLFLNNVMSAFNGEFLDDYLRAIY